MDPEAGFSLIEVVGFFIFGIAIVSAIYVITRTEVTYGSWTNVPPTVVAGTTGTGVWRMVKSVDGGPGQPLEGRSVSFRVSCGPGVSAVISATQGAVVSPAATTTEAVTDALGLVRVTIDLDGVGKCYVFATDSVSKRTETWTFDVP